VVQERDELGSVVVGAGSLQPGRESVDGDVARTQLVGEVGCDRVRARDVDDRPSVTKPARGLPIDDGGAAWRGVHDDVDTTERDRVLGEQTLDVELVGHVSANRERRAVRGEDLLDRGFGCALISQVDDDDGVASARERARDGAAGCARAADDDRHWVGWARHVQTLAATTRGRAREFPGPIPGRLRCVTMTARRQPVLLGRAGERQAFERLLENVRGGQSAVLVVRGEAGVGKTALLHHCARQASGFRVARIAGVESEMELPFAGLHQLCAPMFDRLDALPEPQRAALRVALGLSSGPAPERFLVSLAALSLLAEVAAERPLVCFVDDAQWLDAASRQVLGFVARRLLAESVAIVFAVRAPSAERELVGLPELMLGGLPVKDARGLLATVIPGRLDERIRDRLIAETRGNPLAIVELPRELAATQSVGAFGLGEAQALSGRIEESFLRRLEALPEETRLLLLVAAAEPVDDPLLVWRAAERLGIGLSAATAEDTEGLLAIGERVAFLHPLVRSAVYRSASVRERRAVHLALAEVTDGQVDPDRRAWHVAVAAPGPDEEVASELERSAGRARARGGLAAAAAFLRRSVALTRDPARRVDRALAAAQASLHAGAFDAALELLGAAEAGTLDELQRARAELLRGQVASASAGTEAPAQLLKAARRLEPLDPELARETYLDAWGAALFAGRLASAGDLLDVSRAASAAPRPTHPPHPSDLLLDGLAKLVTEGRAEAAPALRRALSAFRGEQISVEKGLQWGVLASSAAVELWDYESWDAVITRQMELARDAGALAPLSIALNGEGIVVTWRGDFAAAARVILEADAVTEATGTRIAPYGALLLAALRGREAEARALIDATIKDATAGGEGLAVQYAQWTTAVLYNGLGRYENALGAAQQASEVAPELFIAVWALPELIEAAVRSGNAAVAPAALERLVASAEASASDWGLGIAARSRALLSEGEAAELSYAEAIDRLSRTRLGPELARAHLLYGEWLRRGQRRVDARAQLRTAHDMLVAMGADGFADRAHHELLATGAKVRRRVDETRDELTPQEELIARLARGGRTNSQIGAELYLSPRTVEWHLKKVFTKLAISSRMGLHDALPTADPQAMPA
jgi:DNA-binding NarL/FixJ family response regulator